MRGIGVAVMCRVCGGRPPERSLSAVRWRTPKRCCSSTTASASSAKLTSGSISACVPTTSESSPLASRASTSLRRRAGVEPVSSAADTGSDPSSRWIVAKCCSASVSVGAISAAWQPCSTARSIAYRAITVLPLPTSPISSRCIGALRARSPAISSIARRWSAVSVNGSPSRSQRSVSSGGSLSSTAPVRLRRRARRRRNSSWLNSSSSKASRRRARSRSASLSAKWAAPSAAGLSGSPLATRRAEGSSSGKSASEARAPRTSVRICVELSPSLAG